MKAHVRLHGAQKRAMNKEINRQIAENSEEWLIDVEAMVLWTLKKYNGFGKKRLLEFRKHFIEESKNLRDFYEMDDVAYPAKMYLKEIGIDIRELLKEETYNGN